MAQLAGKSIAVLGAGSWGTALAVLLARNGHDCILWGHDAAHLARLAHERVNARFLPGIPFPDTLQTCDELSDVGQRAQGILVAVPSHAFRVVLAAVVPHLRADALVAWATKGMEHGGGKRLSEVVDELVDGRPNAIVSGPSFAREVAQGLPTALTVASAKEQTAEVVAGWLRNERVRVYTSLDRVGVEVGGTVKNVLAIATGISDGLGFGANARAALITRGLVEIRRLGEALGGKPETFMGLTGLGDLVLTCTDDQSRNRRVGLALGRGRVLKDILVDLGQVAEGVSTAREVHALATRLNIDMPITEQVYRVLFEQLRPQDAVAALLHRAPRAEDA